MQTLSVSMMGGTLTRNAKWKLACGDLASGVWFGDQQVEQSPWRQLWGYSSIGCGQWRHMPNWKRTLLPPGTTTPSGPSASPSIPFAMVQKLIVGKRSVENIKTRGWNRSLWETDWTTTMKFRISGQLTQLWGDSSLHNGGPISYRWLYGDGLHVSKVWSFGLLLLNELWAKHRFY